MSVFDKLIGVLAPYDCLACGAEGSLLCITCTSLLTTVPQRCYRCRKITPDSQTCAACRRISKLHNVHVYTDYDFAAKELIGQLKFYGGQAAASKIGDLMALLVGSSVAVLMPVPTATSRVRQRGYDQAKLIARQVARHTKLPYVDCLVRLGQSHQVGSSRRQRLTQLDGAFRLKRTRNIEGATVILVDDVLTTGATLEAAAKTLKLAGAKRVEALVFAQP